HGGSAVPVCRIELHVRFQHEVTEPPIARECLPRKEAVLCQGERVSAPLVLGSVELARRDRERPGLQPSKRGCEPFRRAPGFEERKYHAVFQYTRMVAIRSRGSVPWFSMA